MGLNGPVKGAVFARALSRRTVRIDALLREAKQANDGLYRGVALGQDGVALVGTDKVILVPSTHAFAEPVLRGVSGKQPGQAVLIRLAGTQALHIGKGRIKVHPGREGKLDEVLPGESRDVYVPEKLRSLLFEDGTTLRDPLPHGVNVTVAVAELVPVRNGESPVTSPDVLIHAGTEWRRVPGYSFGGGRAGSAVGGGGNASGRTATPAPSAPPASPGTIVLVCPADDEDAKERGCGG